MTVKEQIKSKLSEWKSDLEHLNVHLHLGVDEAKDEVEEQKKKLKNWLDDTSHKLNELKGQSDEKLSTLRTRIDELRVQAALGKAESRDAAQEQARKISNSFNKFNAEWHEMLDDSKEDVKEFKEETKLKMDSLHTQFDVLKLRLKLGSMDAKDEWNEVKEKVSHKFNDSKHKLEAVADSSEDKFKQLRDELSNSWKRIKDIVKD